MGKLPHILALLSLLALGKGEPDLVVTKTVGSSTKPVTSTLTVRAGSNFALNCKIIESEDQTFIDDEVVWSRSTNDSRFQGKKVPTPQIHEIIDRAEPSKLSFSPITLQDRGTYICTSAAHNRSKSVYITVKSRIGSDNKLKRNVQNPETDDEAPFGQVDDGKMLKELLDSLDKLENDPSTRRPYIFNDVQNIDWSHLSEVKDSWPTHPEWSVPDIQKLPKWDFDIPVHNFSLPEDLFDKNIPKIDIPPSSTYEYRNSFKHFYYTVPVSLILVLMGIVRLCYIIGRKTDSGWQRLSTPRSACTHRICVHRRTTNPTAGCLLERRGADRLSVLIIHRITGVTGANERQNNQADDAPPSYDDSTRNVENGSDSNDSQNGGNDLPPSYNEVLANMSSDATANLRDAVGSSSGASDVLPLPHTGSTQQRV